MAGKYQGEFVMKSICIIDTSIFLNILDVPRRNNDKERVIRDLGKYILSEKVSFFLPMATVLETGNHIAQNGDGNIRRQKAQSFCDYVRDAVKGNAPYKIINFPEDEKVILKWLAEFPDSAGRNKTPDRHEGTSFGDFSIIKQYEQVVSLFPMREIWIWSLDSDLESYHHVGCGSQ
ncbi:hypothetical protein [Kingella denitrificans]|uniref:hypothetical protein n=1 Tax=Kingella denitrificans TaxID=502 RepID=UPI0028D375B7|nr:hypothetical protein [Kingella denitrificans]